MQAAVLQGNKQMEVLDWKRPVPGPFQVVVKVKSCGICGTDQHIYHGHPGSAKLEADVVIECVGRKESMELAVKAAAKGGQVLLFGVSSPETVISVSPFEVFSKELVIKGSFINPYTHEEAISMIVHHVVDVQSLISHRFSLSELPKAMAEYPSLGVSKGILNH